MIKNLPASVGDLRDASSIPGSGRSSRGGHGNPLQHSCLENPMNRGDWLASPWDLKESGWDVSEHTLPLLYIFQ